MKKYYQQKMTSKSWIFKFCFVVGKKKFYSEKWEKNFLVEGGEVYDRRRLRFFIQAWKMDEKLNKSIYNWRVAQISSPLHMNGNTPKSFWQFRWRTLKGQLHILGFYTFIKKKEKNYLSIGSLQRCLSAFLEMDGLYWVCLGGFENFLKFSLIVIFMN